MVHAAFEAGTAKRDGPDRPHNKRNSSMILEGESEFEKIYRAPRWFEMQ